MRFLAMFANAFDSEADRYPFWSTPRARTQQGCAALHDGVPTMETAYMPTVAPCNSGVFVQTPLLQRYVHFAGASSTTANTAPSLDVPVLAFTTLYDMTVGNGIA